MTVAVLVAPQYADVAHVRTHAPPRVNPYGKYRECLRIDFAFTCVYCLSTEREVAPTDNFGAFEIDHFRPQTSFRRLRSSYSNLLWSCHACNRAKGDNWPTAAELAQGMRFPDPCYDAMSTHIRLAGSRVEPVNGSQVGAYLIDVVNLNSAQHVQRRADRSEFLTKFARVEAYLEDLKPAAVAGGMGRELFEVVALLDEMRGAWKRLPPWDAPTSCHCATPVPVRRPRKLTRKKRAKRKGRSNP